MYCKYTQPTPQSIKACLYKKKNRLSPLFPVLFIATIGIEGSSSPGNCRASRDRCKLIGRLESISNLWVMSHIHMFYGWWICRSCKPMEIINVSQLQESQWNKMWISWNLTLFSPWTYGKTSDSRILLMYLWASREY